MLKRLFDIIISLLLILLLSPVFLAVSLLVLYSLGRPILFAQMRPGKNAELFQMLKFRTMRDEIYSQDNDLEDKHRVSKVGEFLRSSSLDELPSLINVVKGDMTFVGPRPLLEEYLDLYTSEQSQRHRVKPGLTGWAQVNGRNQISWEKKFELDNWYIENRNLKLDLKIFYLTFKKVILREGINNDKNITMPRFQGTRKNKSDMQ